MPFAEDYDVAAEILSTAAQTAAAVLDPVRSTLAAGVMVGGRLTAQVTDGLDAAGGVLNQVTAELTELAQLCRERAELCRQALSADQAYARAYTDYERNLWSWTDAGGPDGRHAEPVPPAAPPSAPTWANH